MSFMLGSDPELFVGSKGKVVSAIGRFGGTKDEPKAVIRKGFSIQEDNVLLEYNTPPARRAGDWLSYQMTMREYLEKEVSKQNLEILPIASASLSDEELKDPRAWVFGCDPDFNVWTGEMNPRPHCEDQNFRSAGGHIHVGLPKLTADEKIHLTRYLDLFIGVPLSLLDPDKDRQKLYGKAGAIRFKPYGLEYRTPSNWWTGSERRIQWIWNSVSHAYSTYRLRKVMTKDVGLMILAAIDERQTNVASELIKAYSMELP
jgi:hypothetical protein